MTKQFRVLVADQLAEGGLQPLRSAESIQVEIQTGLSSAQLADMIPQYDALLVRSSTQVTAEIIQAGKRLQVIGRAGTGVDNIDVDAATVAGVIVVNAPTGNTVAAAEHTLAMLMSLARNVPQAHMHVRSGAWKRSAFVGTELRDKVLGTIGLGRVAQEVARYAQSLGMRVLASDPFVTPEYAAQRDVELLPLDEMLPRIDFLTVHVPLTPENRHMIDASRLQALKPGVRILNVARGGIVDEAALVDAIQSGHVAGAALDVFEQEPLPADSPLRGDDRIILTPHLGASTIEAQERVAEDVAVQVLEVLNGQPARYAVNAPILPPNALKTLVPYVDLAERMGRLLRQLEGQGIKRLEITGYGEVADFDMAYVVASAIRGLLAGVVENRVNLVNAEMMARQRGIEVIQRKLSEQGRYENMITLTVTSADRSNSVSGALLLDEPLFVAINDLWVEFPSAGNLLLTSHTDRPGIIGKVGTLLGRSDVNISFMHVGRRVPRGEAIMILGTDEPVPAPVTRELEQIPDIRWLKAVSL